MEPNRRVLAADDEEQILSLYRSFLQQDRAESIELDSIYGLMGIDSADNGDNSEEVAIELTVVDQGQQAVDAVTAAVAAGRPIAVALLDMRMPPGIDGMETALRLREIDPYIHIVIVSAYSDYSPDEVRSALHHNMLFYHKPFVEAEIRQVVLNACIGWDREAELREIRATLEQRVAEGTEQIRRLAQLQQYQAFRSGMEEMSASVMHEIGNALTGAQVMAREIGRRLEEGRETLNQIETARGQLQGEPLLQLFQESLHWTRDQLLERQETDLEEVTAGLQTIQRVVRHHQQMDEQQQRIEVSGPLDMEQLLGDVQLVLKSKLEEQQVMLDLVGNFHHTTGEDSIRLSPYHFMQMMIRLFEYVLEQLSGERRQDSAPVITIERVKTAGVQLQIRWPGGETLAPEPCRHLFRHPALHFVSNLLHQAGGEIFCQQGLLLLLTAPEQESSPKEVR